MRYILRPSREHDSLPQAELRAVLLGESIGYRLDDIGEHIILDTDATEDPSFLRRLAYTLSAWEQIGAGKSLELLAGAVYDSIPSDCTFRVTATADIQTRLGGILDRMGLTVDLRNPGCDIGVFKAQDNFIAGLKIDLGRDYQTRRPQFRPYFHPTSMHPKLARAMVNLARVSPGDAILDPFCGTGGILIEGGLMGLRMLGWDLDGRMVEGARQNLASFGIKGDVERRDALEDKAAVDAIVTDPPYGRSSRPSEDPVSLYKKFVLNARSMLDEGSYLTMMLPNDREIDISGFAMEETFDVRMHKSLTRRVWVLRAE
jgi:tRNA (guanine10-N2)-dimethyltransferase